IIIDIIIFFINQLLASLIIFAGTPTTVVEAGTFLLTKEHAPIIAFSPIITPFFPDMTFDRIPKYAPFFIVIDVCACLFP
ncbi:MAG: hypothetical protein ACLUHK_01170, partial [Eubacteriales bacterium]